MDDVIDKVLSDEEKADIKELVATLLLLPREDRVILLANANAFKVRNELEKKEG